MENTKDKNSEIREKKLREILQEMLKQDDFIIQIKNAIVVYEHKTEVLERLKIREIINEIF